MQKLSICSSFPFLYGALHRYGRRSRRDIHRRDGVGAFVRLQFFVQLFDDLLKGFDLFLGQTGLPGLLLIQRHLSVEVRRLFRIAGLCALIVSADIGNLEELLRRMLSFRFILIADYRFKNFL